MEKIKIEDLSDNIVKQISKIEQQTNQSVEVYSDYSDQSILTLDQASHTSDGKTIKVEITNEKFADFVLLHELYHIELEYSDEPKINVSVTSGSPDNDGRVLSTANSIYETLEHARIVDMQLADGSYTQDVQDAYLQGIDKTLNPNVEIDIDNMNFFRALILFDAGIFGKKHQDEEYHQSFATPMRFVDKAVAIVEKNDLNVPFQFRRALVNLLDEYNQLIVSRGYESMNYHEFLAITPVLSEHQLRLSLNQVYQIKHSVFKMNETKEDAFALLAINDGQSVASLGFDVNKVNPEFYKEFYQQTVKETFETNDIKYLIR